MRHDEEFVQPYLVKLAGGVTVQLEAANDDEVQNIVRARSVVWNTSSKVIGAYVCGSGRIVKKGIRAEPEVRQ